MLNWRHQTKEFHFGTPPPTLFSCVTLGGAMIVCAFRFGELPRAEPNLGILAKSSNLGAQQLIFVQPAGAVQASVPSPPSTIPNMAIARSMVI